MRYVTTWAPLASLSTDVADALPQLAQLAAQLLLALTAMIALVRDILKRRNDRQ